MTDEERQAMLEELARFNLLKDATLPEPPIVPTYVANKPSKEHQIPKIADELLERMMFKQGMKATAKELVISQFWLRAICKAKALRTPPGGRFSGLNPDDFSKPPPLVTLSNADLEKSIKDHHGVAMTARALEINAEALLAYCILNNIRLPSRREIAAWTNTLPRVTESPRQIRALLAREPVAEVAKKAGRNVTEEHLRKYCRRHGIEIPEQPSAGPGVADIDAVKTAFVRTLASRNVRDLETVEIIELLLRHAPHGLTDMEIIEILGTHQVQMTRPMVQHAVVVTSRGRLQRYNGRVHLLVQEAILDLDKLKQSVQQELQSQKQWNKLQAILFVLKEAKTGISLAQLVVVLSWFGIEMAVEPLKNALRQYQKRALVEFYKGMVTLPENIRPCAIRPDETEATPNLGEITAKVQMDYAALANKQFTNVEMMDFVLSRAPQGLWVDEFLAITKSSGVDFKRHCIHSVVTHEAPERFKRQSGRLVREKAAPTFLPRVAIQTLQAVVDQVQVSPVDENGEVALQILIDFPQGLHLRELHVAIGLAGRHPNYDSFRRNLHVYAKRNRCRITDARVTFVMSTQTQNPLPTQPSQEAIAA